MTKTPSKIFSELNNHLKSHAIFMLLTFANAGIISTYLKFIHCEVYDILIVSANSPEAEELASLILKTYDREKPPKSLTMSKYELNNILKQCKDETIVFKDDTVSDNCSKRINSIDTILSFNSDDNCKPFNIAVISNEAQYYIPPGKGILLELDESFGKDYSSEKRHELLSVLNEASKYFADYFCKHIDEYGPTLINNISKCNQAGKTEKNSTQNTKNTLQKDFLKAFEGCFNTI